MGHTTSKRIALSVKPELDDVLVRIAAFENRSKTSVINDLLMGCLPVLSQMADAYDLAAQKKDPTNALHALSAMALVKVGELGHEMTEFNKAKNASKCPDTLEMPLD